MDDGKENIPISTIMKQVLLRCTLAVGIPALLLLLLIGWTDWRISRKLPEVDALAAEYLEENYPGNDFVAEPAYYNTKMECYVVEVHSADSAKYWFYLAYREETLELDVDTYSWYWPDESVP